MPPKMTANPVRPSRYRAGKPTGVESGSSSDESDDEEKPRVESKAKAAAAAAAVVPKRVGAGRVVAPGALPQAMRAIQLEKNEKQTREAIERKAAEEGFVTESEEDEKSENESEESDDDDDDDDDEESSSEDDMPTRKIVLPKFTMRAQRERAAEEASKAEEEIEAAKAEDADENDEDKAAKARQASVDALLEEQLRKQAASRVVAKKQWEDTNEAVAAAAAAAAGIGGEGEDGTGDVNTDDDVDPEAEYAAWKLRELKRIKRQREQIEERERELAEIERRRNLTDEERAAEDAVHLAKQKEEKDSRGQAGFMQKYFHKGAFYQEESRAEGLDKRDLMGAHYVDEIRNREMLPKALQMRDMSKLGRKGASKYRDLRAEDTGRWGVLDDPRRDRQHGGGWDRDRDQPGYGDYSSYGGYGGGGGGGGGPERGSERDAQGANALPLGERKRDRERRRSRSRSPRRSRSRSPQRDRRDDYGHDRRKRSPSRGESGGDKRRRLEA